MMTTPTITIEDLRHENELLKERLAEAVTALQRADTELGERDAEIARLRARLYEYQKKSHSEVWQRMQQ